MIFPVGDELELLRIQHLIQEDGQARLHLLCALLELHADATGVHHLLVGPVPGEGSDHGLGDDAAETAVAFHEHGLHALARCRQRGGEAAGAASYHQDVRLRHHGDASRRFFDLLHGSLAPDAVVERSGA